MNECKHGAIIGLCSICYRAEPEQELKANTELGKKLRFVWRDHCSEDATSGDETLMADLNDGQLLFEAVIALNQSPNPIEGRGYVLIRKEIAVECVSQLWSNENAEFKKEVKLALTNSGEQ